jgi:hypothetical protein
MTVENTKNSTGMEHKQATMLNNQKKMGKM